MDWKTMLAYVTGSVDEELLRRNEYLVADMVFLLDPGLKRLASILKHGDDSHALAAIKVVLDRNELYGYGVEHEAPAQVIAVQTRVNLPEVHLASMSDQDLETYRKLLE